MQRFLDAGLSRWARRMLPSSGSST
jgi:hypothetical protein